MKYQVTETNSDGTVTQWEQTVTAPYVALNALKEKGHTVCRTVSRRNKFVTVEYVAVGSNRHHTMSIVPTQ